MNTDTHKQETSVPGIVVPNENKNSQLVMLLAFTVFGFLLVAALLLQYQFGEAIFLKKVMAGIAGCF